MVMRFAYGKFTGRVSGFSWGGVQPLGSRLSPLGLNVHGSGLAMGRGRAVKRAVKSSSGVGRVFGMRYPDGATRNFKKFFGFQILYTFVWAHMRILGVLGVKIPDVKRVENARPWSPLRPII